MTRWLVVLLTVVGAAVGSSQTTAAPSTGDAALLKELAATEDATWRAFENHDLPGVRRAFADGFVFIDPDGTIGAEELLKFSAVCEERSWSFDRQKLIPIRKDAVETIFSVTQDTSCNGKPAPKHIYLTIVWVRQDGRWLELTHTETPVR